MNTGGKHLWLSMYLAFELIFGCVFRNLSVAKCFVIPCPMFIYTSPLGHNPLFKNLQHALQRSSHKGTLSETQGNNETLASK